MNMDTFTEDYPLYENGTYALDTGQFKRNGCQIAVATERDIDINANIV